jgi:dTDP-4-dehydrorhamnose reductase
VNPPVSSLVVGAFGQVGAQIVRALGPNCSTSSSRKGDAPGTVQLDLALLTAESARALLAEHAPDAVYCVGGMTDVERCESESSLAMRVNCDGPAHLSAAAAARNLPFVYFSTEYIFNGLSGPYHEDDVPDPINAYGNSKLQGEIEVLNAHPSPLILRTTVVYGPDPGEKNFLYSLRRTLQAGRPLRVPYDQISTPTFNRDLAANAVALVRAGVTGVFHVCGPERMSRLELAQRAAQFMGFSDAAISGVPTSELGQSARRPLSAGLVSGKLRTIDAHVPMRALDDSMRDWMGQ